MQVISSNDVKIYNLNAGRSLPEWLPDRKKRMLRKKSVELQKRVELIQDLDMPTLCDYVTATPDQKYLFTLGTYKPRLRCYQLSDLALKFERCVDSQAHKILFLEKDYSKFVLLEDDRWIDFHVSEGQFFKLRIPCPGRDMAFCPPTCDLFAVGERSEIYRVNLSQGRFLGAFPTTSSCLNCCAYNDLHNILLVGSDDGKVESYDCRTHKKAGTLDMTGCSIAGSRIPAITTLKYRDSLNIGLGTDNGFCHLFDIRQNKPWLTKDHGYGFPIKAMSFQDNERVLSIDSRCLKIWSQENGQTWTAFEPGEKLNHFYHFPDSGLIFVANESPKILTYFIPLLGDSPQWCPYLDQLVDECKTESVMYDDYKFITRAELESLSLSHLIGTNFLRAYMHGYFMDSRLYEKAKSIAKPFNMKEYHQNQARRKIEQSHSSRLVATVDEEEDSDNEPTVNKPLAYKLDSTRFQALFEDDDFAIDPKDEEVALMDITKRRAERKERKRELKRNMAMKSQKIVNNEDNSD